MSQPIVQIAIETSSSVGSVTLGMGDAPMETVQLPAQRRHAMELMPTIDHLFKKHGLSPTDLNAVYVSVGPGSFTGLRIAITTAKTLGYALGAELVAVPTLDVIVENIIDPEPDQHAAVMLNAKRGQCFTGIYQFHEENGWVALAEPALLTPQEVCERLPESFVLVGDHLPDYDWSESVELLPSELATPKSEVVWKMGYARQLSGQTTRPMMLNPLYVRLPEAEEVWQAKQASNS